MVPTGARIPNHLASLWKVVHVGLQPRVCAAALTPLVAVSGLLVTAWPAHPASSAVVISEVYGGGNSLSVWTNHFVELYNRSDTAVDVSGWVVQYYSATATAPANTTTLAGTVASHHAYLVRMSAGTGGTTALPTPEATGTALMSGTNGHVDLLQADSTVVDRVGYGTATTSEGTPVPALSNTSAATRNSPCTDTDDNATDFRVTDPTPENSSVDKPACAASHQSTSPRRSRRSRARAISRPSRASWSTASVAS
jgi:uncharacterized protein